MLLTKWLKNETKRHKTGMHAMASKLAAAAVCLALAAGCSLLPPEDEPEPLPEIRTPKISQKPEYPVKRGTLELTVSGTGKLLSEREENLFFTEDNRRIVGVYAQAGDRVKKGQVLAELDTGDLENQILRKEIELEKAGLDLKLKLRDASGDGDMLLRKQKLDYELLKAELDELRGKLEASKLTAPYDGTLVSFTAKTGDLSKAYEKIGQIADMNDLVVAVQFAPNSLEDIAPGMDAIVSINAMGDFRGKVRRLPVASGQGGDEDSLDARVLIDLETFPQDAGYGTPLSAAVVVERRENVLTIPLAALRKQNSRYYVIVSGEDGSKGEVDVEIGIQTSTDVEIIRGLEEGQKVVGK